MAIIINTESPQNLLDSLKETIQKGRIKTWLLDSEGDLTSANPRWMFKAWFEPHIDSENQILTFGIIPSTQLPLTNEIYAVYHGRLASTMLAHFDFLMEDLRITPKIDQTYDRY